MAGLSQSEYVTIKGIVLSISDDILTDNNNNVLYKISINPNSVVLENNGNKIQLTNGELGEVRIKYDSLTWTMWAFKKIGIIDR